MDSQSSHEMTRKRLVQLIRKLSYREGDFTLASGKKSTFYIDVKTTALHPEGAHLIGELTVDLMERGRLPIDGVGGLTLGADPIGTAVSLASRSRKWHWPAFIVRKEPKKHGTSKYVEGSDNLKPGAKLLVVEDVATTGASSLKAVERLRAEGYQPIAVLTVVDREEGADEAIRAEGLQYFSLVKLSELKN